MIDLPIEVETPAIVYEAQDVQSAEGMLLALLDDTLKNSVPQDKSAKNDGGASRISNNSAGKNERRPFYKDTKITDPKEVEIELKKMREEYKRRYKRNIDFYRWAENPMTDEDRIVFLKHALKNNRPFSGERIEVSYGDMAAAEYELHFNKKIPKYQYAEDVKKTLGFFVGKYFYIFELDSISQRQGLYILRLLERAVHETNEPYPEKIVVTGLDMWIEAYRYLTGRISFPAWFDECSYEDKLLNLKNAFMKDNYVFVFLTREKEDSIKVELKKLIATNEKKISRKMTELERVKTEYEIQFRDQPPVCECSDKEWHIYLKHLIKYNIKWIADEPITKDQVHYIISGEWWEDVKRQYK